MSTFPQLHGCPTKKAHAVNQTSAAFVAKIPKIAEPIGDAGTDTGASILEGSNLSNINKAVLVLIPFGEGADGETFSVRIIGWEVADQGKATELWTPVTLAELLCTLTTVTGVAGRAVSNTENYADTIAITFGNENVSVEKCSPANDTIAHAVVSVKSFNKIELSFKVGTATSANALIRTEGF